jgi:hypothetical protein
VARLGAQVVKWRMDQECRRLLLMGILEVGRAAGGRKGACHSGNPPVGLRRCKADARRTANLRHQGTKAPREQQQHRPLLGSRWAGSESDMEGLRIT